MIHSSSREGRNASRPSRHTHRYRSGTCITAAAVTTACWFRRGSSNSKEYAMPRFNFWSLFNNNRFEDLFARLTGGSADHDHLNGTTGGNILFAGASADSVAGMA